VNQVYLFENNFRDFQQNLFEGCVTEEGPTEGRLDEGLKGRPESVTLTQFENRPLGLTQKFDDFF
jgi:hypothetical protein